MHEHNQHEIVSILSPFILLLPFITGLIIYFLAIIISHKKQRPWPIYRTLYWMIGISFAMIAVVGPLAERSHVDFSAHMLTHLFLGMFAPLLMVLAAPMTLILRALSIQHAKLLTDWLKSRFIRFISDPAIASILNIGGLWLLYTTNLYAAMHESLIWNVIIHLHIFLAGYLFTLSMIYIEPTPHRKSYLYRSIMIVLALAGHGILAKYLYANPPVTVSIHEGEIGSIIMYYGGDLVDMMIMIILCWQWYKETRPRISAKVGDLHT
ncbi:cytochrome c oxidase assembly protein [Gracilibacillus lacisalsi]|uniref:cytochrome c oxidase assembly protein n=1 Tax=Gracilibacillus lacisalsi TaxID=393087 RepID=UPI000371B1F0|nr:cytochrome c oxidase assembly protein [Gracilibacillus lacisalsi]